MRWKQFPASEHPQRQLLRVEVKLTCVELADGDLSDSEHFFLSGADQHRIGACSCAIRLELGLSVALRQLAGHDLSFLPGSR